MLTCSLLFFACMAPTVSASDSSSTPDSDPSAPVPRGPALPFVLRGGTVLGPGGAIAADVEVRAGVIVRVGEGASPSTRVVDVAGRWIVPAFIDSHVHLAYLPEGEALADNGIAGAVDMAAPESFLASPHAPLRVLASGPMITAVGGYPTQGWGRNGYGLECTDAAAAVAGVDRLVAAGAKLVKLPVTGDGQDQLTDDVLAAVVAEAHRLGVKVASHALGDEDAARAAAAGVDVLAHTPTEALSTSTITAWAGRTVVSTLAAFGDASTSRANLAALSAGGAQVLYGTDFGNAREAGINADELRGLTGAGFDGGALLAAGTWDAAAYWGFDDLGTVATGKAASFLVLDADPRVDPSTLSTPRAVYIDGRARK